ncbi:putative cytoplasmic protein [Marinobacterium lacunae]|uniref:Putative cytoplasmic protein n=1 Tax=Marinobacterium lacunae TaxID=1232683 RepID=A0A081FUP9_9GAMM|nr:hypothetical protein [Marinobacterium lacunae]KEA62254.1 putative cytoplasmic protein [Marinobacterium lacunae]
MPQSALMNAYHEFMDKARPFLNITNEDEYVAALEAIEQVLESSKDASDDPMKPLIRMLCDAIARYESLDAELAEFEARAMSIPIHISVLRVLMDQYTLTESDFPEIGDRTIVSRILAGQHALNLTFPLS